MEKNNLDRRDFIKLTLVGTGTVLGLRYVPKVMASSGEEGESDHRWAMVIDQAKCNGCDYCTLACRASNDVPPEFSWNRVIKVGEYEGKDEYLPIPCMHCEQAPCVDVCPVGASYHRPDGIVMMDYDRCIGCRYCQVACPYGARFFNWETFTGDNPAIPLWGDPDVERRTRGVVEKCTFCFQRIDRGLALGLTPGIDPSATPACVNACPQGARLFGDLNDPESSVRRALSKSPSYRLKNNLGTAPRVYYLPADGAPPEVSS